MRVLQLRLVGICILIRVAPRSRRLFTKKIRSTVGYRIGGAFPREHLLFFARNVRNRRQLAGFPIFFPPPFSSFPSSFFHKRVTDLDRERSLDYENLSRERERGACRRATWSRSIESTRSHPRPTSHLSRRNPKINSRNTKSSVR